MAEGISAVSGNKLKIVSDCALLDKCPIQKAIKFKELYFQALGDLDEANLAHAEYLRMAYFVAQVADNADQSKAFQGKVWKEMRPKKGVDTAMTAEDTAIYEEIVWRQKFMEMKKQQAGDAAQRLIDFITDQSFETHMVQFHSNCQISLETAKQYYDVDHLPPQSSPDQPILREIDHYLALLTERLVVTEQGQSFLKNLFDEDWVKSHVAFSDVWDYAGKVNSILEPVGKFVYNAFPILNIQIKKVIANRSVQSIPDVINSSELSKSIKFLEKKLKIDIPDYFEKRAEYFATKGEAMMNRLRTTHEFDEILNEFTTLGSPRYDPAFKAELDKIKGKEALDNAWIGLSIDMGAFLISLVKILADLRNAEGKDYLNAYGNLMGLAKTITDNVATQAEYSNKPLRAAAAKKLAIGLGVAAGIATIILQFLEVYEGWKSRDWDVMGLNVVGIAITGFGIYGIIMDISWISGFAAVLTFALAIVMAAVLDSKLIDYLEDTYWGEDGVIAIKDTVSEYFKKMFTLELSFNRNDFDANNSCLRAECWTVAEGSPVFVEILEEDNSNNSLQVQAIYPNLTSVAKKGRVVKNLPLLQPPNVEIYDPWDIWPGIARDDRARYTIKVGIDPSDDITMKIDDMSLNKTISGVTFPAKQVPILLKEIAVSAGNLGRPYGNQVSFIGPSATRGDFYAAYPASGLMYINVYTKYGSAGKLRVEVFDVGFFTNDLISDNNNLPITARNLNVDGTILDETKVNFMIKPPPPDDYYTIKCRITLFDSGGKELYKTEYSSVRIASQSYIDKLKAST